MRRPFSRGPARGFKSSNNNRPPTNHIVHDRRVRVKVCDVFARDLEPKHKGQIDHKRVRTDKTERSCTTYHGSLCESLQGVTVRAETLSKLIFAGRKIEFESCTQLKTRVIF